MEQLPTEKLPRDESLVVILRYLVAHPTAKDTIRGIAKWWLPKNVAQQGKRKIKENLDLLVSAGWLISRSSPQSETIYSLNENSLMEIKEFLDKGL